MRHHCHYLSVTLTGIKQRCLNPKNKCFGDYGGRGIKVHPEWLDKSRERFQLKGHRLFTEWVLTNLGEQPPGKTLDRIDNNGNYEPGNLRWADKETQMSNRRTCPNSSGFAFVKRRRNKSSPDTFVARFRHRGVWHQSRGFKTPAEAHARALEMREELGIH